MSAPPASPTGREPRWRVAGCFLLSWAAVQLVTGPIVQVSQWGLSADRNVIVAEGVAWTNGRLDLPSKPDPLHRRMHDTAFFRGKVYNVFPPLLAMLTAALAPLHRLLLGAVDVWLSPLYVLLVFVPLPILAYFLLRRECGDSIHGGALMLFYFGGTALLPMLYHARYGNVTQVNHILSQTGLLLLLWDLLGKRRIWPGLIGLAIAGWSRQLTLFYAVPLLLAARRSGRLPLCIAGLALVVLPIGVLNQLKFGNPFDSGYAHIYAGRDDWFAQRAAAHGLFSPHFILENLWCSHFAPAKPIFSATSISFEINGDGTGLWFTSPLFVLAWTSVRRWWRDPARRELMLASCAVMAGLLCYHATGLFQSGYARFPLDFLPVWLAILAPTLRGAGTRRFAIVAGAWSLLYFHAIASKM